VVSKSPFAVSGEALKRLQKGFQVDQKTFDTIYRTVPFDPAIFKVTEFPIQFCEEDARAASVVRFDSQKYKELMGNFSVSQEAVKRLSESFQVSQAVLDKVSGFQIDPEALYAIQRGLQVDRVTQRYVSEAAGATIGAGAALNSFRVAMESDAAELVSLPTLVELWSQLPDKNRRDLRDKVVGIVVLIGSYIYCLNQKGTTEAAFALAGLFVALLFLHSGVVNAFDVLEEERANGVDAS
jgi:hypothetical protein